MVWTISSQSARSSNSPGQLQFSRSTPGFVVQQASPALPLETRSGASKLQIGNIVMLYSLIAINPLLLS